ncbi:hypothetical protein SUGI_0730840 [Cryptomeria japonica]|uniref:uncharacterized protein LOC131030082 n=1 Tax=Cryptomeria japonica TaxID=3369 RepID=UPI002414BA20|nr:uncharacterized protein LOC131030082 [Cryptomeria japonica]GLJ36400.1 hypothetical protein SUGI_0730840 [Cryptomeria japonica]
MEKHMHRSPPRPQQQQKEWADCRKRKPFVEDDRRISIVSKKMRLFKDTEYFTNNNASSNYTSYQGQGSARTSQSPQAGFDPLAIASNGHKIPPPCLPPPGAKAVNRRLACFLAREYLQRGTLMGKPWPPQDSNTTPRENATAQLKKNLRGDEAAREQEALYSTLTSNFLCSDDIHIPGIFNPSQMAAWFGLK